MARFTGRFSDGRSAVVHQVAVSFGPDRLIVAPVDTASASGTQPLAAWSYGDLVLIETNPRHGPIRLTTSDDGDARLSIETDRADFIAQLKSAAPRIRKRHPLSVGLAVSFATLAVGAGLLYAALTWMPPVAARLIPAGWEVALGRQTVDGLASIFGQATGKPAFCMAEPGQNVLDELAGKLARAAGSRFDYRVRVLDNDIVNAFATSGGHVVFFRGLIEAAESPDEVSAVLAHEIAHVEEHHVTEAMVRALGAQIVINALFGGGGDTVAGFGQTLITNGYSRDAEREADAQGLTYLRRAGLRTGGMARFFRRIQDTQGETPAILGILSTHPPTEERIRASQTAADTGHIAMSDGDWAALKAICGS